MTDAIDAALEEHGSAPVFALFSGGHDSLCSTHVASQHPAFVAVAHINTGIGIEETRDYVRATCRQMCWPLLEYSAPADWYDQRCLERGMPGGPVQHSIMYEYLKQAQVDRLVREHKGRRGGRVALVTGVRLSESARRRRIHSTPHQRERAIIWINPIRDWSGGDVRQYMEQHSLPRNPVVDKLHRSGECLCGALADPKELDWIAFWYPDVAARIRNLERQCFVRGLPYNWGRKPSPVVPDEQLPLPLCQGCATRWDAQQEQASAAGGDA